MLGYLGKDPEISSTQSGTVVARFPLATTETVKNEKRTEWHNIVCFGPLAEICSQYLTKGSLVYFEGRIQSRSWDDKSGEKKYITEIVCNVMQMLGDTGRGPKPQERPQRSAKVSDMPSLKGGTPWDDEYPF